MQPDNTELVTFDREQAFLLYASFAGDCERTAHALNVRPLDILRSADECGWAEKLKAIFALKKSARPGDLERGINRALNFVQAHRARLLLERVITRLSNMTEAELDDYLMPTQYDKLGNAKKQLVTRPFADLAASLEKVSAASYQALADTAQDRAKREEADEGGEASGNLHAQIAKAMAAVAADRTPRAMLLEAQISQGQAIAAAAKVEPPIEHPNDSDEH